MAHSLKIKILYWKIHASHLSWNVLICRFKSGLLSSEDVVVYVLAKFFELRPRFFSKIDVSGEEVFDNSLSILVKMFSFIVAVAVSSNFSGE